MTRVPVVPSRLRFQPDPRNTGYIRSLAAVPLGLSPDNWLRLAANWLSHTTYVVQVQPGEITREQRLSLRRIGMVLADYGHQLLIEEEGEPLRDAADL